MFKYLLLNVFFATTAKCQLPALIIDKGIVKSLEISENGEMAIYALVSLEFVTQGGATNDQYSMVSLLNADVSWNTAFNSYYFTEFL